MIKRLIIITVFDIILIGLWVVWASSMPKYDMKSLAQVKWALALFGKLKKNNNDRFN